MQCKFRWSCDRLRFKYFNIPKQLLLATMQKYSKINQAIQHYFYQTNDVLNSASSLFKNKRKRVVQQLQILKINLELVQKPESKEHRRNFNFISRKCISIAFGIYNHNSKPCQTNLKTITTKDWWKQKTKGLLLMKIEDVERYLYSA